MILTDAIPNCAILTYKRVAYRKVIITSEAGYGQIETCSYEEYERRSQPGRAQKCAEREIELLPASPKNRVIIQYNQYRVTSKPDKQTVCSISS